MSATISELHLSKPPIPLTRSFFEQPTVDVARQLIGVPIQYRNFAGIITETEAYVGQDDPACHAARGMTPRTKVMFGPAGYSYIYLIYGMYWCLNIVTEVTGYPAAVLIRGLKLDGIEAKLTNGPGKLCKVLDLDSSFNNQDLINHPEFKLYQAQRSCEILTTPRIGITKGQDKLWRFVCA